MFFIIGIRRSGTSILRELMMKHPEIRSIEFEPHPLWFAVDMSHFSRFKDMPFVKDELMRFKRECSMDKWYGAKFALNPGVKGLEWKWLPKLFPEARFIFLFRGVEANWKSYKKQDKDSVRGMIPINAYRQMHSQLYESFEEYWINNPETSTVLQYERLLNKPDQGTGYAFSVLGLDPLPGMAKFIKQPEFK